MNPLNKSWWSTTLKKKEKFNDSNKVVFIWKVGDLYNSLENTLEKFYEVIGKLDLSQGPGQLKEAEEMYKKESLGGRGFYKKYLRLREEIVCNIFHVLYVCFWNFVKISKN